MNAQSIALAVAFVVCAAVGTGAGLLIQGIVKKRRLSLAGRLGEPDGAAPVLSMPDNLLAPPTPVQRFDRWFVRLIGESGLSYSPETAFFFAALAGLAVCGVLLFWRDDLLAAAAGLVTGMLAVLTYYLYRRSKRRNAIREQLPDV